MTAVLPIVERLTHEETWVTGTTNIGPLTTTKLANPDGAEAGAIITELYEALDRMVRKFGGVQSPPLSPGQNAALEGGRAALAKVSQ